MVGPDHATYKVVMTLPSTTTGIIETQNDPELLLVVVFPTTLSLKLVANFKFVFIAASSPEPTKSRVRGGWLQILLHPSVHSLYAGIEILP